MKGLLALGMSAALAVALPLAGSASGKGRPLAGFEVGAPDAQLAQDITPVARGMGAVFVPSLTRPELEPMVRVLRGDTPVARGKMGQRIALPPGTYRVLVGQGPEAWRAGLQVAIEAGRTTVTPFFYAALRVTAVDGEQRPQAVTYTLVGEDGRVYGPERTHDAIDYDGTRTWLVPPGRYIVALGRDGKKARHRAALTLPAGDRSRFRLVVDSGAIVRTEFAELQAAPEEERFRLTWVLGGSLALDDSTRQITGFSGQALRVDAFTELEARLGLGNHLGLLTLKLDQGWVGLEHEHGQGLPFQKLTDRAELELLYSYRLGEIIGPYARGRVQTAFFDTKIFAEGPASVVIRGDAGEGTIDSFDVTADDEISLLGSLAPLVLQAGAGIGLTAVDLEGLTIFARAGVAYRRAWYGDNARWVVGSSPTLIRLQALSDASDAGLEATGILRVALWDRVSLRSEFDAFIPVDAVFGDEQDDLVFRWKTTVSLAMASWASLVYSYELHRDETTIADRQQRHTLGVRLQAAIF